MASKGFRSSTELVSQTITLYFRPMWCVQFNVGLQDIQNTPRLPWTYSNTFEIDARTQIETKLVIKIYASPIRKKKSGLSSPTPLILNLKVIRHQTQRCNGRHRCMFCSISDMWWIMLYRKMRMTWWIVEMTIPILWQTLLQSLCLRDL